MLNKERREVINAMSDKLSGLNVDFEKVGFKGRLFTSEFEEWVHSEYVEPFKLTQAEKCILEELAKKGYIKIQRNSDCSLNIITSSMRYYGFNIFKENFKWLESNTAIKISDILENCEVVEDVD